MTRDKPRETTEDDPVKPAYADIFEDDDDQDGGTSSDDELFGGRKASDGQDHDLDDSGDLGDDQDEFEDEDASGEDLEDASAGEDSDGDEGASGDGHNDYDHEAGHAGGKDAAAADGNKSRTKSYRLSRIDDDNVDLYVGSSGHNDQRRSANRLKTQSFEQRLKNPDQDMASTNRSGNRNMVNGNRIMTFVPRSTANQAKDKQSATATMKNNQKLIEHRKQRKRLARRTTGLRFNRKLN